jgi:urease accessory protein
MTASRPAMFRAALRFPAFLFLLPAIASAHPGHYHPGEEDEFDALTAGFLHPLGGIDHLLLALAVGWLAFAWLGGKSRVGSLAGFLGALGGGALIGRGLGVVPGMEWALSLSLMAAGVAFIAGGHFRSSAWITLVVASGLAHGFAHGAEAAASMVFPPYALGLLASTTLLLATGALLQQAALRTRHPLVPRSLGASLLCIAAFSLFQSF